MGKNINMGTHLNDENFGELETVDPNSPYRCSFVSPHADGQQCKYKRKEGSEYCPRHSRKDEDKRLKQYRLTKFKSRVADFATNPEIKNLREEIGILRMALENIINICNNTNDLIMHNQSISSLVLQIDKLVNSCHKMEVSTNQLLDKNKAMILAEQILEIIQSEVEDNNAISKIALRIGAAFKETLNNGEDQ